MVIIERYVKRSQTSCQLASRSRLHVKSPDGSYPGLLRLAHFGHAGGVAPSLAQLPDRDAVQDRQ